MTDPRETAVDLIFGRWRSRILHAGVKLGIFDALADGARSAADTARRLSLDTTATYRLMRALGSLGVLTENEDGSFALSASGTFFRGDHPQTLRGMTLLEEGPEHYAVWRHLCDIVRDGGSDGFVREFGRPAFAHIVADAAYGAVFNEAMSSYSAGETDRVLEALDGCDLSGIAHLCDIGGGHGHLLCHFLDRNPGIAGTVYDLPETFDDTERLWANRLGVADRCSFAGGDMFLRVPPADAYVLKHILHDWSDAECVRILENVHRASPPRARVFVAEFVVPGPETPHFSKLFDVHMLCATTGQERTEREYAALFDRAGWRHANTWYPASGLPAVVEATKG